MARLLVLSARFDRPPFQTGPVGAAFGLPGFAFGAVPGAPALEVGGASTQGGQGLQFGPPGLKIDLDAEADVVSLRIGTSGVALTVGARRFDGRVVAQKGLGAHVGPPRRFTLVGAGIVQIVLNCHPGSGVATLVEATYRVLLA